MRKSVWLALGAATAAAGVWFLFSWSRARPIGAGAPSAASADQAPRSSALSAPEEPAERPAEREAVVEELLERTLELVLVRFPDEAPLDGIPVEVEPLARQGEWLMTSAEGRVSVTLSPGAPSVRVAASGYEPHEEALRGPERTLRFALTPSSGLFGRVVRPDGAPAPRAEVRLVERVRQLERPGNATRSNPGVYVSWRNGTISSATTDERGLYYLSGPTRTSRATVRVAATSSDGLAGALEVALPREPAPLEDVVLHEAEKLVLRVIDTDGRAVPGATVWSYESPLPAGRARTDEHGVLEVPAPLLPARFSASKDELVPGEQRHDGQPVRPGTPVETCRTRVELVLTAVPAVKARFIDAETGFPIFLAHGSVELFRAGESAGNTSFQPDAHGEARLSFSQPGATELPDLARVSVWKEGYRHDQTFDLDPRAPSGPEPIVLALEPEPGWACLRGRALRAGEPVPELQVGLKALLAAAGTPPKTWQYARTHTDAEGRFALRWRLEEPDQVVTVFPHWVRWDEFAFIGPLGAREAVQREHVLELQPAVRVPAVLRGVVCEGEYRYYVAALEGEVAVDTTINGAPIAVAADGEVRTTILLPRQRRSRVTIGFVAGGRVLSGKSNAVEYDPVHPLTPLVFEVESVFASLRGRVVGFAGEELARLGVGFVLANDQGTKLVQPAADGSFELTRVPRGEGDLFLVREGEGAQRPEVLARLHVAVERDLEGLVLAADPLSLPERAEQR